MCTLAMRKIIEVNLNFLVLNVLNPYRLSYITNMYLFYVLSTNSCKYICTQFVSVKHYFPWTRNQYADNRHLCSTCNFIVAFYNITHWRSRYAIKSLRVCTYFYRILFLSDVIWLRFLVHLESAISRNSPVLSVVVYW